MSSYNVNSDHGEIDDSMKTFTDINCLLNEQHGYSHPKLLGEGSYGVVIRYRRPQNEGDVAVKCVFLHNVREGEGQLWFGLKHENIVPLLQWTIFESLNVVCFEMEVYEQDLFSAVRKAEYLQSADALQQLKMWLYQALSGINFLHERQLYHLDIKSDNVFISRKAKRALIADFTFLRRTSSHIRRYHIGLPHVYHPPETSRTRRNEKQIDGLCFDLWSYGVMTMELLTNFHIARSFPSDHRSADARYACMRNVLQEEAFTEKVQTALPAVEIIHGDILMALDFMHSFLRRHPTARTTAEVGLEHSFLGKGDIVNGEVDALWKFPSKYL
ncbi:hypothetical protein AVEN_55014-1 [Araneus ventricosus]|uniref:Protein kinase domain-containing protein n=1 Tax=Araneus ventricosus TaxID=182803 RepID=A0A4Y2KVF5_ARAVE|nr:hypothetical protein AVEN_55014-1 [Araneus ventricosus]